MNQSSRIEIFDILKGISIIAVIIGHVAQQYQMHRMMQIVYSFHMPMFFMISGYFIHSERNFRQFVEGGIKKLLIPYCIACAGLIGTKTIIALLKQENFLKTFAKWSYIALYGTGNGRGSLFLTRGGIGHTDEIGMLWFLLALFWAELIVYKVSRIKFSYAYIAMFVLCGLISSKLIWFPWSIQNGMACSGWVFFGYLLRTGDVLYKYQKTGKRRIIMTIAIPLWLISILFGTTHLYENYYKLGMIDMAGALGGCIIIYSFADKIGSLGVRRIFSRIGCNSLVIYIVHFWEEKISYHYSVPQIVLRFQCGNRFINLLISTIIILGICLCFTYAYSRAKRYINTIKIRRGS